MKKGGKPFFNVLLDFALVNGFVSQYVPPLPRTREQWGIVLLPPFIALILLLLDRYGLQSYFLSSFGPGLMRGGMDLNRLRFLAQLWFSGSALVLFVLLPLLFHLLFQTDLTLSSSSTLMLPVRTFRANTGVGFIPTATSGQEFGKERYPPHSGGSRMMEAPYSITGHAFFSRTSCGRGVHAAFLRSIPSIGGIALLRPASPVFRISIHPAPGRVLKPTEGMSCQGRDYSTAFTGT